MRYFDREIWFKLPLKLRRRWWRETDYSKNPPNADLMDDLKEAIINVSIQAGQRVADRT
jgi:hypothetical protein